MKPLIIAYALNVIDYLFTAHWVRLYGAEIELNPITRWAISHDAAWLLKIVIVGGCFALLGYFIKKYPRAILAAYICLAVYAIIVGYHIFILIHT